MSVPRVSRAQAEKTATENESVPAGTANPTGMPGVYQGSFAYRACHAVASPMYLQYRAADSHGRPRPRKTFTLLEPVMLPMEASAYGSCLAAVIEANVSGKDVPSATRVIAVVDKLSPKQPTWLARSPISAVSNPISQG